jgi:hypothetical protein
MTSILNAFHVTDHVIEQVAASFEVHSSARYSRHPSLQMILDKILYFFSAYPSSTLFIANIS